MESDFEMMIRRENSLKCYISYQKANLNYTMMRKCSSKYIRVNDSVNELMNFIKFRMAGSNLLSN